MAALLPPVVLEDDGLTALRHEVRAFLDEERSAGLWEPGVDTWLTEWDPAFSRRLADRGWVGMTVPVEYGGRGRGFLERFAVTEELLAAAAPVAFHWVADRQVAPALLRYGTEQQKRRWLPRIAAGECAFGIGMSEPDSGSDLASVRTRAERVDGGWRVTGTKVWTSGAHEADAFIALVRTSPVDPQDRHAGLTQLVVDLRAEGVRISPIRSMTGGHHVNEVHLDGVLVPDADLLGELGAGWEQVTSELAFERSGPERWLSTFPLVEAWAEAEGAADAVAVGLGAAVARMRGLHQMSLAVAGALEAGADADVPAAMVKLLGTTFEGDLAATAHLATRPEPGTRYADAVTRALLQRPGFTLRGGTNEVLRGVLARGLGLRGPAAPSPPDRGPVDPDLVALVDEVFADHAATLDADAPLDEEDPGFARRLAELGLDRLASPEPDGGGASWHEAAVVLRAAARHGIPVDTVLADLVRGDVRGEERERRSALATCLSMTGAMDGALDLTVRHVTERTQFGRPVAAFQAVQQLVVDAASEAALARAATDAALAEAVEHGFGAPGIAVSVAAARSVCARAGSVVVRNTHQAHGAVGTTLEHPLHRTTMPLLAWTTTPGPVPDAEDLLATAAREQGVWPVVSGTPAR